MVNRFALCFFVVPMACSLEGMLREESAGDISSKRREVVDLDSLSDLDGLDDLDALGDLDDLDDLGDLDDLDDLDGLDDLSFDSSQTPSGTSTGPANSGGDTDPKKKQEPGSSTTLGGNNDMPKDDQNPKNELAGPENNDVQALGMLLENEDANSFKARFEHEWPDNYQQVAGAFVSSLEGGSVSGYTLTSEKDGEGNVTRATLQKDGGQPIDITEKYNALHEMIGHQELGNKNVQAQDPDPNQKKTVVNSNQNVNTDKSSDPGTGPGTSVDPNSKKNDIKGEQDVNTDKPSDPGTDPKSPGGNKPTYRRANSNLLDEIKAAGGKPGKKPGSKPPTGGSTAAPQPGNPDLSDLIKNGRSNLKKVSQNVLHPDQKPEDSIGGDRNGNKIVTAGSLQFQLRSDSEEESDEEKDENGYTKGF